MREPALLLRPGDDVAVATLPLQRGETLRLGDLSLRLREDVAAGHKVALRDLAEGSPIRKLAQTIGFASTDIAAGAHVHVHNCEVRPFGRDSAPPRDLAARAPSSDVATAAPSDRPRTFRGFVRADGCVGTRNYVVVACSVNCSATAARRIAERVKADLPRSFPNVDGVLAITHKGGCGLQEGGPDHEQLTRTIAGFMTHPNVAGSLLVGLGCEVAQAGPLARACRLALPESAGGRQPAAAPDPGTPAVLTVQESGGLERTIEAGVKAVARLLARANEARRVEVPASKLLLGLQCGGSDGYSAVTANPALGAASDLLVAAGGTVILAETPEIYGAEHLLTSRASSREVAEALMERIRWWERYTEMFGATINNNPSPGNKEGGITTIYEKSLGAVAKGGSTALTAVYRYAERVTAAGLVFMDTPGYDPVSMTGIVAGGATIGAFTTGRGSVYGCKPSPSIKIATSTELYRRMEPDMDIDAGVILEGTSVEAVGRHIFERMLAVAGGERTKSEAQGLGDEEFAPWSIGPTL